MDRNTHVQLDIYYNHSNINGSVNNKLYTI